MAAWTEIERSAPELAQLARRYLDARVHKTIATLRRDGSPRISGNETIWAHGDLWLGMMPGSQKASDLQRDGRFALHTGSADPPAWDGDAKLDGTAIEVRDAEAKRSVVGTRGDLEAMHLFRLDIRRLSVVSLAPSGDRLVIESWREGGAGVTRRERA